MMYIISQLKHQSSKKAYFLEIPYGPWNSLVFGCDGGGTFFQHCCCKYVLYVLYILYIVYILYILHILYVLYVLYVLYASKLNEIPHTKKFTKCEKNVKNILLISYKW